MKQFCVFLLEGKQELKLGGVDKGYISVLQTVNSGWFSAFNVESKHLMSIFWLVINEECIVTPDW